MLEEELDKFIMKIVDERIKEAWEEIVLDAPMRTGNYISSIQVDEPTEKDGVITARVYTDLDSGWNGVPLGAFLEYGTGPKGKASNTQAHGYGYRDTPWVYYDEELQQFFTTEGHVARPHFFPAEQRTIARLKKDLEDLK